MTAAAQLNALRNLGTGASSVATAIDDALALINNLQSLSIDSTAARNDADRLLVWWQSRSAS